jgi:predicted dinucleotide-binding enzyme
MTKVGILGAGKVASGLGELAITGGHDVRYGTRTAQRDGNLLPPIELAQFAELFVLAVPYSALDSALPPLRPMLDGKIVVDATNPVAEDWSPVELDGGLSAAEVVAHTLPEARVVKAFNTVFADNMRADRLVRGEGRVSAFIASDDAVAADAVADFAASLGFNPVVTGKLAHARYLEAIAHLNIALLAGNATNTSAAFLYDRGEG